FKKQFRTISFNAGGSYTSNANTSSLLSDNIFYSDTTSLNDSLNQRGHQLTTGYKVSSGISYTEPVGKSGMMFFNYSFDFDRNRSFKETNDYSYTDSTYSLLDSLLSSTYETQNISNQVRVGYRL